MDDNSKKRTKVIPKASVADMEPTPTPSNKRVRTKVVPRYPEADSATDAQVVHISSDAEDQNSSASDIGATVSPILSAPLEVSPNGLLDPGRNVMAVPENLPPFTKDLISEFRGLNLDQLFRRVNEHARIAQHHLLAVCLGLGIVRQRIDDFGDFCRSSKGATEYFDKLRYIARRNDNLPDIDVRGNAKRRHSESMNKDHLRENALQIFRDTRRGEYEEFASRSDEMRNYLGLKPGDKIPKSFLEYITYFSSGYPRINDNVIDALPNLKRSAIYSYSEIGKYIVLYPEFFSRVASSTNIEGQIKKLSKFGPVRDAIVAMSGSTGADPLKDRAVQEQVLDDILNLNYLDYAVKYNFATANDRFRHEQTRLHPGYESRQRVTLGARDEGASVNEKMFRDVFDFTPEGLNLKIDGRLVLSSRVLFSLSACTRRKLTKSVVSSLRRLIDEATADSDETTP